ncbi:hypothetical protein ACVWZA_001727 [Sphingomonas sp. UYAg733]
MAAVPTSTARTIMTLGFSLGTLLGVVFIIV